MERLFIREKSLESYKAESKGRSQVNIGITGLGQDVGTTFVGTSLAFCFAESEKNVTYFQCVSEENRPLLYEQVAMEKRFENRRYVSPYQSMRDGFGIRQIRNIDEKINWLLPVAGDEQIAKNFSEVDLEKIVASVKGEVCIFDIDASRMWDGILSDMDFVIVVVDPAPRKLMRQRDRMYELKHLEAKFDNVIWVVNKMNNGVNKREIRNFIKSRRVLFIDFLDESEFYSDEFCCRFNWNNRKIQGKIKENFTKLSQLIYLNG